MLPLKTPEKEPSLLPCSLRWSLAIFDVPGGYRCSSSISASICTWPSSLCVSSVPGYSCLPLLFLKKTAVIYFRADAHPVWPHFNLIVSVKTLFPNKVSSIDLVCVCVCVCVCKKYIYNKINIFLFYIKYIYIIYIFEEEGTIKNTTELFSIVLST